MSIVLRSDFENVKAQLEDTQESLAAAFARIEVFRQREKLLLAEVSKLRTAQAANATAGPFTEKQPQQQQDSSSAAATAITSGTSEQLHGSAAAPAGAPSSSSTQGAGPAQQQQQQPQQQPDPGPDLPCYITEVEGHLPVMLLSSSGRRTPGSIVITPDYVDFVEVRARIKRHSFIGVTAASVRPHSGSKQGLKLKNLLPSCISPTQMQPASPTAPRYPPPSGGFHTLQQQQVGDVPAAAPGSSISSNAAGAWIATSSAADIQPEASTSSMSWQQQLHYQDLSAAAGPGMVTSPQRARRTSAGSSVSQLNIKSPKSPPPAEAVLGSTPDTPSGWAASHSLRHCTTWSSGHTSAEAGHTYGAAEAELTEVGAAAAAAAGSSSPRGSNGSTGGWSEGDGGREAKGVWKILWRGGGMQQQLSFEATQTTREVLHKHTMRWLGEPDIQTDEISQLAAAAAASGGSATSTAAIAAGVAAAAAAADTGGVQMAVPRHLTPGSYTPRLSEPSNIIQSGGGPGDRVQGSNAGVYGSSGGYGGSSGSTLSASPSIGGISMGHGIGVGSRSSNGRSSSPLAAAAAAAAGSDGQQQQQQQQLVAGLAHIAAALPPRYQSRDWQLVYSTARHGISLQTLFRKAAGQSASVLLVRDGGGYVFGAFCPEAWRPSPRFFGTGETFVFQLAPHKVLWPWKYGSALKNDFFQYAQPDSVGVGGLGAFAIWLDGELLHGSSGSCGTFGSPCLASKEEFKVAALELWSLQ